MNARPEGFSRGMPGVCAAPPTAKPAPILSSHADHLRSVLDNGHGLASRAENALDRLIGTEPQQDSKGCAEIAAVSCYARDMQAINDIAEALVARLHRIAQRLDAAI